MADLCASLRVKLERVVKEACARTFLFHLVETADESFFLRTKVKGRAAPAAAVRLASESFRKEPSSLSFRKKPAPGGA